MTKGIINFKILYGIVLLILTAGLLYSTTNGSFYFQPTTPKFRHFDLQADGFIAGQLNLAYQGDARIDTIQNPYDSSLRRSIKAEYPWDAAYFNKKYYLYWGPAPIILFYIPWKLVTGQYPTQDFATFLFSLFYFLTLIYLLGSLLPRDNNFLYQSFLLVGSCLIFLNTSVIFSSHNSLYVFFIVSGVLFSTLAWVAAYLSIKNENNIYMFLTSLFLCTSIASRFSNIVHAPFLFSLFVLQNIKTNKTILISIRNYLIFCLPILVCLISIAAYNFFRFGNPFTFGMEYQLGVTDQRNIHFLTFEWIYWKERLLKHIWYDLLAPFAFMQQFPYIDLHVNVFDPARSFLPSNFPFAGDYETGVFATTPILVLGLILAPFIMVKSLLPKADRLITSGLFTASFAVFIFQSACWYKTQRYQIDFMGFWLLISLVGVAYLLKFFYDNRYLIRFWGLLTISSLLTIASLYVGFAGIFRGAYG